MAAVSRNQKAPASVRAADRSDIQAPGLDAGSRPACRLPFGHPTKQMPSIRLYLVGQLIQRVTPQRWCGRQINERALTAYAMHIPNKSGSNLHSVDVRFVFSFIHSDDDSRAYIRRDYGNYRELAGC